MAGSSSTTGRIAFVSYGLAHHRGLLPTSPHDDAVTVGLQAGERMPGEDFHLSGCVRLEAHHGSASRHGSSDDASTSALRSCRPLCLDRHSIHAGGRRPPAMLSSLFADPRAHKPLWSSAPRRSPRLVLVVVVPSTERDYLPAKYSSTNGLVVRSRPMVVSGPCPGWTMASSPRGNSTCVIDRISVA